MWAKQSTAATLIVGPILDSTGAEYTGAVIGDLSISKNGGTLTAMAAAATLTHIANGQYTLVTTTGNLDTLGRAQITCNKSTYQMPEVRLMVVPANVFDSMILGSDFLQSDAVQFAGQTITAAAGVTIPASIASPTNITAATGIVLSGVTHTGAVIPTVSVLTGHTPQTGDSFARIGAAGAGLTAVDDATLAAIAALNNLSAAQVTAAVPTTAQIAAAVDVALINTGDGSDLLQAIANQIAADWVAGDASPVAVAAAVRTNLATELARIDAPVSTRASQTSVDDVPTNAELATALGTADDATLAAIAAEAVKTAAIKVKTDQLTFTTANKVDSTAVLDSASRLAIWNTLTTETFTADSFGELLLISDGTNGREVKVTGANHIAADVHEFQAGVITAGDFAANSITASALATDAVTEIQNGLATSAALATESGKITNIENASGYLLAVLAGACADPQTASETYAITVFGSTFTVDMAGQTSTGTRTAPTLTKS